LQPCAERKPNAQRRAPARSEARRTPFSIIACVSHVCLLPSSRVVFTRGSKRARDPPI
jgi:hypothetical protein